MKNWIQKVLTQFSVDKSNLSWYLMGIIWEKQNDRIMNPDLKSYFSFIKRSVENML